jgi:general secretion pathway protein K
VRRRASAARRSAGFALLIVLWGLVLLSLIAGQLGAAGRSEAKIARNLLANAQAEAAADAAVFEAAFRLIDHSPAHWDADGLTRRLAVGDSRVWVTVQDDAGKLNPNAATVEQLTALLGAIGAPGDRARAIAQAIVDWRGGRGAAPPDALAAQYRAAGLAYRPPGEPFTRLDEIALVVGVTPTLFTRLAPYLSIAQRGAPDASRADPLIARILAPAAGGAGGASAPRASTPNAVNVVTIVARAETPDDGAFTRRATLQLGRGPALARGYAVIAWEAVATE